MPIGAAPPTAADPALAATDRALVAAPAVRTPAPSTNWAISGVRGDDLPAPGNDWARSKPAPMPGPDPPAKGWLDSGLAPSRPIWASGPSAALAVEPPMLPVWLNNEVAC